MRAQQLVVSGFHRSCTSMTMQALVQAGLVAGDKLMPADPSNADGHFEDVETVNLHDQWLQDNHSNWCHSGELPVVDDRVAAVAIRAIADRLNSQGRAWGVKDPRASLFLSHWFTTLESVGGFFSYRHFASCFDSLQRRHADDLLLYPQTHTDSFPLFSDPTLALTSWLAYNKNIIAQIKRTPDRCLLVSQSALVSGFPLVEAVNKKFSMNLDESADLRIDQSKVTNTQSINLPDCSQDLIHELNQVWDELQSLSVAPSENVPNVTWGALSSNEELLRAKLLGCWDGLGLMMGEVGVETTSVDAVIENEVFDLGSVNFNDRTAVTTALAGLVTHSEKQRFLEAGLAVRPGDVFFHAQLGNSLFYQHSYELAMKHLTIAVELQAEDPAVYFNAAHCHMQNDNRLEARRLLQISLVKRRNPDSLWLLLNLYMDDSIFKEAQRLAMVGYEWFPEDERFVLCYADALAGNNQVDEAVEWLLAHDDSRCSDAVAGKLYAFYMRLGDIDNANRFNLEMQRRILRAYNSYGANANAVLNSLNSHYARQALMGLWVRSLGKLMSKESDVSAVVNDNAVPLRVAMSILVRDEVDIIESNIRYHAAVGIEHFIVTDNASIDGTRDVLATLRNEFSIDIIDESAHTIDQDLWVTRMAQQLQMQDRFDWIIHNDADEFWVPENGSIPDAIRAALNAEANNGIQTGVLACKRLNMLTGSADVEFDDYAFHDNVHAVVQNVPLLEGEQPWSAENSNCVARMVMDKVLTRADGLATVEYGNHGAEHDMEKADCSSITILHFPIRTYEQFERKVVNYGESLANNTRFSEGSSLHLRHWYQRYLDGCLRDDYDHMVFTPQRLQALLASGHVKIDTRVSNHFKTVVLGGARVPLRNVA